MREGRGLTMKANKENVNLFKELFIDKLAQAGWHLTYDGSYIYNPGNGLRWVSCLQFVKGDETKTLHHSGTTRQTLNFYMGACKAATYFEEQ